MPFFQRSEAPTQEFFYRGTGQLEKEGVEKLPLTPITLEAEKKLRRWGIPKEVIQQLREFSSQFRYDRCLEKVKRLTELPVYIEEKDEKKRASLPFFFDVQGRFDGQCGDIARQFLIRAEITGLVDHINSVSKLKKDRRIVCGFFYGKSRTHFNTETSKHVWNGLSLVDEDGEVKETVIFDSAFQEIATQKQSGYQTEAALYELSDIKSSPESSCQLGWVEIGGNNNWKLNMPELLVLGVSNDRKYSYSLGFAFHRDEQEQILSEAPLPILSRIDEKAFKECFFLDPKNPSTMYLSNSALDAPDADKREIFAILTAATQFKFTTDPNEYPVNEEYEHIIKF